MFSKALFVLASASVALATVFVTAPISSTTFTAGQQSAITWQDDGNAPSLAQFGPAKISIYAGNAQQQTLLQSLSTNTDVSQASSLQFTPDPSIGPNSAQYFIRFESLSFSDPNQPLFPALAFSARFTLAGMTGTFSADVQAQIDGQSTAPLLSTSTAGGAAAPSAGGSNVVTSTSLTTVSNEPTSTSAKPTATNAQDSSAINIRVTWLIGAFSALVGMSLC